MALLPSFLILADEIPFLENAASPMNTFSSLPPLLALFALGWGMVASRLPAADTAQTLHYHDEVGFRHLTLQPLNGSQVEVRVRWASDPGGSGVWLGQGMRKEGQLVFAAVVEDGQDRGTYFVAKGEGKLEIAYKPGQKMPQDPGILGAYRRVSDDKRLQLARKEFQAAEDRLAATIKASRTAWLSEDKAMAPDWKARWPALRARWMQIAYQPPTPPSPQARPPSLPSSTKEKPPAETDVDYWLKLAQATAMGYYFMQQVPDGKSKGAWAGDYNDGFGGSVSIRMAQDGQLRVSLNCTRFSELQGADLQGAVPAEALKTGKGAEPATAEAVFTEPNVVEAAKDVRVILKRKGGFLWVETQRKQEPAGRLAWFDGIYLWTPVPTE